MDDEQLGVAVDVNKVHLNDSPVQVRARLLRKELALGNRNSSRHVGDEI